jgi:hypothetical protein
MPNTGSDARRGDRPNHYVRENPGRCGVGLGLAIAEPEASVTRGLLACAAQLLAVTLQNLVAARDRAKRESIETDLGT